MTYQPAQFPMTLTDLQGHSSIASHLNLIFRIQFWQQLTRFRPCRAVPLRQLSYLFIKTSIYSIPSRVFLFGTPVLFVSCLMTLFR